MDQAQALAQFVVKANFEDIPEAALHAGKRGLLDCLGTALGGARSQAARMAFELIEESGGNPQATLLTKGKLASVRDAALYNATAAHALDYDDTLSSPAAMAALALAEQQRLGGRDLVKAYVLGFEVASRMTKAIGGWENTRGWHMMGVAGVFGAATAASVLLKLNSQQTVVALGCAASQASGLVAMHGFLAKPFHSGKAAANGLFAAQLALHGCTTGPALEGPLSLSQAMGGTATPDFTQNLGDVYAVVENRLKPFPCGRLGHAAIEAALKARSMHQLTAEEIVSAAVSVEPRAQYLMGRADPENGTQSMFSISHAVAAALRSGRSSPDQFTDEAVRDTTLSALRRRVEVLPDPALKPGQAKVTVQTKRRGFLTAEVSIQKGYSGNPLTDDDVREKFLTLAEPIVGQSRAQTVVETVYGLESLDDAGEVARLCA